MTAIVGLLYVAEVSLAGWWRLAALTAALGLLLGCLGERRRVGATQVAGVLLLAACAALTWSPVLLALAVLLLIPRSGATAVVSLTMAAFGLHLLWWRYLSVLPLHQLPAQLAAVSSSLLGGMAYVMRDGIVMRGQSIRFSIVPVLAVVIPIAIALLQVAPTRRSLLVFAVTSVLSFAATFEVAIAFALVGHVHFFSAAGWPLVSVLIGTAFGALVRGESVPATLAWGKWVLAAASLAAIWSVWIAPTQRPLHILFDEAHGKWETIEAQFGRDQYGRDTVYNYALLARWLSTKHTVLALDHPWDEISGDVLVIKMPTEYFTTHEKRAIDSFVHAGGLLLVIGDHTNLYGTAFIINDLLAPYGFEMEATATVPWDGHHYDFRPAWWQRSRYLRGVQTLQFQTAATIRAHNPRVTPIIVGTRVVGEDADYSNERFFGDLHPGPEDRHPPLVFAAERRLGQGRILLFGDSTMFSSFSLMAPGNRELFQNFVEQGTRNRSALRIAIVLFVTTLAIVFGGPNRGLFALALVPPVFVLCTSISSRESARLEAYPAEWVEVDGHHSHMQLRFDPQGAHGPDLDDYSTFFAWIGRTGAMPRVSDNPYADPAVPTIVVNPDRQFITTELEKIDHYVKQGGRLLVMDDPRFWARSTAAALLERFGIALQVAPGMGRIYDAGPPHLSSSLLALPFDSLRADRRARGAERARAVDTRIVPNGLTPLQVDDDGTVIGGKREIGSGIVILFLGSAAFSDFVMGDVWGGQDTDPERKRLYQLAYDFLSLLRTRAK